MKLTELAQAIEDGKKFESLIPSAVPGGAPCWVKYNPMFSTISLVMSEFGMGRIRIKPTKKPIDLAVLIQSGIDCEFWDGSIGVLSEISCGSQYHRRIGSTAGYTPYSTCKPRMGEFWYSWQGGECPLPEGLVIEIQTRNNGKYGAKVKPFNFRWNHDGSPSDVIAFKVIGLAEGYCWPWESES